MVLIHIDKIHISFHIHTWLYPPHKWLLDGKNRLLDELLIKELEKLKSESKKCDDKSTESSSLNVHGYFFLDTASCAAFLALTISTSSWNDTIVSVIRNHYNLQTTELPIYSIPPHDEIFNNKRVKPYTTVTVIFILHLWILSTKNNVNISCFIFLYHMVFKYFNISDFQIF